MITSTSNSKVRLVRALQNQRRAREKQRLFVVEGLRLAGEAVASGVPARLVLHTRQIDQRGQGIVNQFARLGATVETVSPAVMKACSDTKTPQGLLAVLPIPEIPLPEDLTFVLILDRLADPGNLGTILRTAAAAGVDSVFLTPGTVDTFNPRVVRGGMGAHFHLPLRIISWPDLATSIAGLNVWLADVGGGLRYDTVEWRKPCALIVGNEAAGPGDEARELAAGRVYIPMPGQAESLNVAIAAGVLMFEILRQRAA